MEAQADRAVRRSEIEEAVAAALAARLSDPTSEAAPAVADATFEIDVQPAPKPGSESFVPIESITNARAAQLYPKPFAPLATENRKPSGTSHVALQLHVNWRCDFDRYDLELHGQRMARNVCIGTSTLPDGLQLGGEYFEWVPRTTSVRSRSFRYAVRTVTLPFSLPTRRSVAMTATNVAEEANREAGRVRNQPVRPPPIDVDTTLAIDDVPEDDKTLRWYSITIDMAGAQMPAMWFGIIGAWMTSTPAGTVRVICVRTALTRTVPLPDSSEGSWRGRDRTRQERLRSRAQPLARYRSRRRIRRARHRQRPRYVLVKANRNVQLTVTGQVSCTTISCIWNQRTDWVRDDS